MKKILLAAVLSITGLAAVAQDKGTVYSESAEKVRLQDVFTAIELSELPQAIIASVVKYYPTATINRAFVSKARQYKLEMSLKDGIKGTFFTDEQGNGLDI